MLSSAKVNPDKTVRQRTLESTINARKATYPALASRKGSIVVGSLPQPSAAPHGDGSLRNLTAFSLRKEPIWPKRPRFSALR
jgi:hypothetical protein